MKTRTLMLLALACGLAIMLAGAVFLVRLAGQPKVPPASTIGQAVTVGDLSVTVESASEAEGSLAVTIRAGGVDGDITGDFRLIASGRRVDPAAESCVATVTAPAECVLRFDVAAADGTSRVLFVDRGDEQGRWVLAE